jgi:hypothetical protein
MFCVKALSVFDSNPSTSKLNSLPSTFALLILLNNWIIWVRKKITVKIAVIGQRRSAMALMNSGSNSRSKTGVELSIFLGIKGLLKAFLEFPDRQLNIA